MGFTSINFTNESCDQKILLNKRLLHRFCYLVSTLAGAGCSGPEFGPGGENDHLNAIKLKSCIKCIQENRDILVGVKVRLDR